MAITKDSRRKILAARAKIKRKPFRLSPLQVLIVISPILVVITFFLFAFLFWHGLSNENKMPKVLTNKEYNYGQQYLTTEWKTYHNKEFDFSVKYPAEGYIQDPKCFEKGVCNGKVYLNSCGKDIKSEKIGKNTLITLDNMIGIIVIKYNNSLYNYFMSQGANINDFEIKGYDGSRIPTALYAAKIESLKKGVKLKISSEIVYPSYFFGNGKYFLNIIPVQNFGSKNGCLPPVGSKANSINSYWDIPSSITFE
jgi:hypothetical protein